MNTIKRLCVFCGSSPGANPKYLRAASEVGAAIARRGWGIVYGGAQVGVMGAVANAALKFGGEVIGVIPEALARTEVAHSGLSDLRIVRTMHERKALMADLSDGFLTLPGGCGTFEEFFEVVTWAQIGIHSKPCGLLNVAGYFNPLLALIDHAVTERFVLPEHGKMILVDTCVEPLLESMAVYAPIHMDKWLDRSQI